LAEGLADPTWTAAPEQTGDFGDLPPAVVMDLDETVLDNSPYQAWLVETGGSYGSDTWVEWCEAREATVIPGALEFVQAAVDAGVTVWFVSNRPAETEEATRDNLEALGFGFALTEDFDNVLLKREQEDWGSDKGTRRIVVAETHRVVLSIGDNLGDFVDGYKVSIEERDAIVADNLSYWGERWIVLANPTYGSWEQTLYDFDYGRDPGAVFDGKVEALNGWNP
jgi:acid phosphatase